MRGWQSMVIVGLLTVLLGSGSALADEGHMFSSGIDRAKRATVGILSGQEETSSRGAQPHFSIRASGVHLRDGYILTARHAVTQVRGGRSTVPREITVLTGDLDELPAVLTGVNGFLDIAVYQVVSAFASALPPPVAFGKGEPEPGREVFTVGYPLGWGPTVAFGRVGNPNTFLRTVQSRLIQVDMAACSGNSGGGLFNTRGEIVGMVHAIIQSQPEEDDRRCSRFAFAVPGPLAERITQALIDGKRPRFSRLGIQLSAVKRETRWQVAVSGVSGPALKAGIQKGDILLFIEDVPVTSAAQLKNYLIERTHPGERVQVRVSRDGKDAIFYITLGGV